MPKVSHPQNSFNSGELSPLVYGRTDAERYKNGLATCINYIPMLQGPLVRRPGSRFAAAASNGSLPPIVVPFEYSTSQIYMLEIGNFYIRFFLADGGVVSSTTTYYQIQSSFLGQLAFSVRPTLKPYLNELIITSTTVAAGPLVMNGSPWGDADDLSLLKVSQDQNSLYFAHPNFPTYQLKIFDTNDWVLQRLALQDGPYLGLNTYVNPTDGVGISLTTTGHVAGAIYDTVTTGPSYSISNVTNNGSGAVRITTSAANNYVTGQKVCIVGLTASAPMLAAVQTSGLYFDGTATPYWVINVISTTTFDLIGSTFAGAYTGGGTAYPALFTKNPLAKGSISNGTGIDTDDGRPIAIISGGKRYYGNIAPNLPAAVNCYSALVLLGSADFPTAVTTTMLWYMGVYWGGQTVSQSPALVPGNYPCTVTFHQDRLWFGGALFSPQQVDGSMVGRYNVFSPSSAIDLTVADNNAMSFILLSRDVNAVRWMASAAQGLLAGTTTTEWNITPSSNSEVLTPTNINAVQTSFYGSSQADVVQAANATLHITRAKRKLRELNYFFQVGTFRSTDLTELSENITLPSIVQLAAQRETQPIIWMRRSDGALVSMIYNRDDVTLKAGPARHWLGGYSDSGGSPAQVVRIAVIPSSDRSYDQLWMVVKRWINGATVYYIEYLSRIYNDGVLQEDAIQGDCSNTYDHPLTITGISIASTAVVTAPAHGLSNGDQVRIVSVVGLNHTTTDINGNSTATNLVNEKTFVVAGATTNTFQLNDFSGNPVSSVGYSAWVSGGQVRKMVIQITGLSYLAGETLGVLADGAIHPPVTVSAGGVVDLQFRAAKVQLGYAYNSDAKLLRTEAGSATGTSIGQLRRVHKFAIMAHDIGDLSVGMSFNNLIPVKLTRSDVDVADQATPLAEGVYRDGIESTPDFENQVCFRQSSMLPGMIQSITVFLEETDV